MDFARAFNDTLNKFKISAKWLSDQSGVAPPTISTFRHGQHSTKTEVLERLITALPKEAKIYFFNQFNPSEVEEFEQSAKDCILDAELDFETIAYVLGQFSTWIKSNASKTATDETETQVILRYLLEASLDGLLVLKKAKILHFNARFVEIWKPPAELIEARNDALLVEYQKELLENSDEFVSAVADEYHHPETDRQTLIRFKDGRSFVRTSTHCEKKGEAFGRVVSYRSV